MSLTNLRIALRASLYLLSLITLSAISACTYVSQGVLVDSDRHAKAARQDSFGDSAERVVYPEQNWSGADSLWFYNVTQGSNLIPYEIFYISKSPTASCFFAATKT